jgi:phage terminase small subunit
VDRLTNKQRAFVAEYPKDWNGTQAAIRAGYAARTANRTACVLLTKHDIQAAIAEIQQAAKANSIATLEECCRRLTEIIRADLEDFEIDGEGHLVAKRGNMGAVQEKTLEVRPDGGVRARLKLRDPVQAMARLAAFLGLDKPTKLEVDAKTEVVVPDTLGGLG